MQVALLIIAIPITLITAILFALVVLRTPILYRPTLYMPAVVKTREETCTCGKRALKAGETWVLGETGLHRPSCNPR